jgi:hypothetical protein
MIRLRKHDRKMLKVSAVLASGILVLLGLIWVDMQRGFRSAASPVAPAGMFRGVQQSDYDRNADRDSSIMTVASVNARGTDPLFYPDGTRTTGSSIGGDFSDHSSAFETSGSENSSSIPEPSTLAVAAVGGGMLLLNRRRAIRFLTA